MQNMKFIKMLSISIALTWMSCSQAFSSIYSETTCSDTKGLKCWQCGNDCIATVYNDGKLIFKGSGTLGKTYQKVNNDIFGNSPITIKSVIVGEGFTTIPHDIFWGAPVSDITLPNSIEYIGSDTFSTSGGVSVLSIADTTKLADVWQRRRGNIKTDLKIICRGDIQKCENNNREFFSTRGVNPSYTDEILDENGRIKIKYNKNGYEEYLYDSGGNLIRKTDENGNILWRKRIYTPAEATAAVSGNGKNTFVVQYR